MTEHSQPVALTSNGNHGLLPCPFCGSADTVQPITAREMWVDMDVEVGDDHTESFAVVCSVWEEGCGATSGFMLTREQAKDRWNARPRNETCEPLTQLQQFHRVVSLWYINWRMSTPHGAAVELANVLATFNPFDRQSEKAKLGASFPESTDG